LTKQNKLLTVLQLWIDVNFLVPGQGIIVDVGLRCNPQCTAQLRLLNPIKYWLSENHKYSVGQREIDSINQLVTNAWVYFILIYYIKTSLNKQFSFRLSFNQLTDDFKKKKKGLFCLKWLQHYKTFRFNKKNLIKPSAFEKYFWLVQQLKRMT